MRKLGRWKLLWVLVSGLLLIPAVYFARESLPTISDIRHEDRFYGELSAEARSELAQPGGNASEVTMENGHVITVQADISLSRTTPVLKEYNDIITARLHRERVQCCAIAFLSWAAVCVALYFLGWAAGRVYRRYMIRGFRGEE